MARHDIENTPAERAHFIDIARGLAAEFAARGRAGDEDNQFPLDTVPLYKASGLARLQIPKDEGGLGGDIWSVTLVSKELAKGDPAIALSFNMHQVMVGLLANILEPAARDKVFERIIEEDALLCGGFSEERAGITGLADTYAIPQPDGGFRLNGKKTWTTLAEAADLVSLNAAVSDENGNLPEDVGERAATECTFWLPMDSPGISVDRTWDTMGMRATGTQTVVFDDVYVSSENFGGNFRQGLFGHFEWVTMPFSGVYCGHAEKAYEECRDALRTKTLGATPEGKNVALAGIGFVQYNLGRMLLDVEAAKRVLESTARILFDGRDAEWHPMARAAFLDVAKVTTTETALRVCDGALRLIGGGAFRRGSIFERLYRDSRAGPFHPLTTDQAYDLLGRAELGLLEPPTAREIDTVESAELAKA